MTNIIKLHVRLEFSGKYVNYDMILPSLEYNQATHIITPDLCPHQFTSDALIIQFIHLI